MKDYTDGSLINTPQEEIVQTMNPIDIKIEDDVLVRYVDDRIEKDRSWYTTKKNLYERQKRNEEYLLGKQIDLNKLKPYNARYIDNIIYEAESTIKPIALSRLPDLYVTPNENQETVPIAKKLTDFINSEIRRRENRRVLSIAFKHVPIGFIGAIKYRWNPAKGKFGDYEFYPVHYSRLVLDHNAKSNDVADMDTVAEYVDMSVKTAVLRFPDKKDELFQALGFKPEDEGNEQKMASQITIVECWFKWYDTDEEGNNTTTSGVLWKYKKVLLKKMKNPNWDWEGDNISFQFDEATKKDQLDIEQIQEDPESIADETVEPQSPVDVPQEPIGQPGMQPMALDPSVSPMSQGVLEQPAEQIFHNYFEQPEFPYIFLGYDQYATMPYDETSRIEQVLSLQDIVNKRGKQITEMADRAKGKHLWYEASGMSKKDIEMADMEDPNFDLLLDGDPGHSHEFIPGEQPSAALFQDQDLTRQRIFQKMGTNSTTRGQKETDVATTAQILRESDFGRIDDLVEDTINYAAEKMARAVLQLIKLRYTEDHMKHIMGKDGSIAYETIHRDMIQDGMDVVVHASGVDKMLRKREAYEKAQMKLIDPLSFFEDTDTPNPKERTERLMYFMSDPNTYMTKYVLGLQTSQQQGAALNNAPTGGQPPQPGALPPSNPQPGMNQQAPQPTDNGGQEATQAIMLLEQGQQPPPPSQMTPGYISTMDNYLKSPQFQALDESLKQQVITFAQGVAASSQQGAM